MDYQALGFRAGPPGMGDFNEGYSDEFQSPRSLEDGDVYDFDIGEIKKPKKSKKKRSKKAKKKKTASFSKPPISPPRRSGFDDSSEPDFSIEESPESAPDVGRWQTTGGDSLSRVAGLMARTGGRGVAAQPSVHMDDGPSLTHMENDDDSSDISIGDEAPPPRLTAAEIRERRAEALRKQRAAARGSSSNDLRSSKRPTAVVVEEEEEEDFEILDEDDGDNDDDGKVLHERSLSTEPSFEIEDEHIATAAPVKRPPPKGPPPSFTATRIHSPTSPTSPATKKPSSSSSPKTSAPAPPAPSAEVSKYWYGSRWGERPEARVWPQLPVIRAGARVEAKYGGDEGLDWYEGRVRRRGDDGTYEIEYDDGDEELCVAPYFVRPLPNSFLPLDSQPSISSSVSSSSKTSSAPPPTSSQIPPPAKKPLQDSSSLDRDSIQPPPSLREASVVSEVPSESHSVPPSTKRLASEGSFYSLNFEDEDDDEAAHEDGDDHHQKDSYTDTFVSTSQLTSPKQHIHPPAPPGEPPRGLSSPRSVSFADDKPSPVIETRSVGIQTSTDEFSAPPGYAYGYYGQGFNPQQQPPQPYFMAPPPPPPSSHPYYAMYPPPYYPPPAPPQPRSTEPSPFYGVGLQSRSSTYLRHLARALAEQRMRAFAQPRDAEMPTPPSREHAALFSASATTDVFRKHLEMLRETVTRVRERTSKWQPPQEERTGPRPSHTTWRDTKAFIQQHRPHVISVDEAKRRLEHQDIMAKLDADPSPSRQEGI